MEQMFYVLVTEQENQYGHEVVVNDVAYKSKKQAQKELSCTYECFVKDCDGDAVDGFDEYSVTLSTMKDFTKWRITSATYPQFFVEMRIEPVTVTI